jgi:hypothetical protein
MELLAAIIVGLGSAAFEVVRDWNPSDSFYANRSCGKHETCAARSSGRRVVQLCAWWHPAVF